MKTAFLIGLVIEVVVGGLFLLGVLSPVSRAQPEGSTDNTTSVVAALIPDIGKIYRAALASPLQEAERGIQDEEIAEFYHRLIQKYELDEP